MRLAGIEPSPDETANATEALTALIAGRDVILFGNDDQPDRYGRQRAFVALRQPAPVRPDRTPPAGCRDGVSACI